MYLLCPLSTPFHTGLCYNSGYFFKISCTFLKLHWNIFRWRVYVFLFKVKTGSLSFIKWLFKFNISNKIIAELFLESIQHFFLKRFHFIKKWNIKRQSINKFIAIILDLWTERLLYRLLKTEICQFKVIFFYFEFC